MVVFTRFRLAISLSVVLIAHPVTILTAQTQNHPSHLLKTDPVDVGRVIARGPDSVTVTNDRFTRVFRTNRQTVIQRVDSTQLQIGDSVAVRCHFDNAGVAIADSIEANVDRWEGRITRVVIDAVYIAFDAPVNGTAKVVFDRNTEWRYCAGDRPEGQCSLADLNVGRHLETIGFAVVPMKELRATRVLGIQSH